MKNIIGGLFVKSIRGIFKKNTQPISEEATQKEAKEIGRKLQMLSRSLEKDIEKYMEEHIKEHIKERIKEPIKEKNILEMVAAEFNFWNIIREDRLIVLVKKTKGYRQIHEVCAQLDKKVELDFRSHIFHYVRNGNIYDSNTDNVLEKRLAVIISPFKPYAESSDVGILVNNSERRRLLPKIFFFK